METKNKQRAILIICVAVLILGVSLAVGVIINRGRSQIDPSDKNNCRENGINVFEYKENPSDSIDLTTTLVLSCGGGILTGYMFGPYPAQEHGLFYFSSTLEDLKVDGTNISFKIPRRDLFAKPFTIDNYANKPEKIGFSNAFLIFSGRIDQGSVNLTCQSDPLECYSGAMKFVKVR